jgi:hypothetical protein
VALALGLLVLGWTVAWVARTSPARRA